MSEIEDAVNQTLGKIQQHEEDQWNKASSKEKMDILRNRIRNLSGDVGRSKHSPQTISDSPSSIFFYALSLADVVDLLYDHLGLKVVEDKPGKGKVVKVKK